MPQKNHQPSQKKWFFNNSFPDAILQGDPSNAFLQQPTSKAFLIASLADIKDELNNIAAAVASSPFKGKSKHPGFNYFNVNEWLQFADMHFRHHLRQKQRIDLFLKEHSH